MLFIAIRGGGAYSADALIGARIATSSRDDAAR
jgi:hypothetical protein